MADSSFTPLDESAQTDRKFRIAIIVAAVAAIVLAAALAPNVAQPEAYHRFADHRAMFGIPNFLDVVSNLAFAIFGFMGLAFVVRGTRADGRPAFIDPSERWGWSVVFFAAVLTCCGSAYYHLAPDSARLTWDRLPMTIAFMALVSVSIGERVSVRTGNLLLVPLLIIGAASVWYWRWTAAHGNEDLNFYGAVQFGSLIVILLLITLLPARYTRSADYFGAVGLYALAKVFEHFDRQVFESTGHVVSGHTIKHLLAATAILWILRMLRLREPLRRRQSAAFPA